ncbi:MAG TPA: protein kinase [Thermoanaerobaculia bacterium]|nr:protein kinase [Thermoanaerobaculia bacterium]
MAGVLNFQRTVGRFEVKEFLGRGGHADVYLAWDPRRGSNVALKVIPLGPSGDAEMLEAEQAGIRIQARLAQVATQVAAVYEYGELEGAFYVSMEYVEGSDLARVLAHGALSEERALHIAYQLCQMLEQCHAYTAEVSGREVHGIVHGDIKPENIRLQGDDRVRVLDFGIAKHLSQQRRYTRNLFGTPPYTPPERLERGLVDPQSDLWAVAVVLYLMVSGYPPYAGGDEELEQRIRAGDPPRPLPAGVSPGLKQILGKALAYTPAGRYQTASDLKADLDALREGRPLAADAVPDPQTTRRTVQPVVEGATRRTDRAEEATAAAVAEPTRRTEPPTGAAMAAAAAESELLIAPPPAAGDAPVAPRRRRRVLRTLLLLAIVVFGFVQAYVWREAREIRREVLNNPDPDLSALVDRVREIGGLSILAGPALGGARKELHDKLVAKAEPILAGYHGDNPTTREGAWRRADDYLRAAVELDWSDNRSRARMLYTSAHLDRIEAQSLRDQGKSREALEKTREAVSGFRDAARRDPDWPDPWLGLARVYAYLDFDLDELRGALEELAERGYRLGRRERAMLADGHRMRAAELLARAGALRGEPGEVDALEEAREQLLQAVDLYDQIRGYANVRGNLAGAERQLQAIEDRLLEISY